MAAVPRGVAVETHMAIVRGSLRRLVRGLCRLLKSEVCWQETDALTQAMKDLAEAFPELMRPLIQERDEYMVFVLRTLASRSGAASNCPLLFLRHKFVSWGHHVPEGACLSRRVLMWSLSCTLLQGIESSGSRWGRALVWHAGEVERRD